MEGRDSSSGSVMLNLRFRPMYICGAVEVAMEQRFHSIQRITLRQTRVDRRINTYAPSSLQGRSGRGRNELDMRRRILCMT